MTQIRDIICVCVSFLFLLGGNIKYFQRSSSFGVTSQHRVE